MTDVNEILNEAIPRWAELTGTRLGASSHTFAIGSSSEFQDYDLQKYVRDLNTARERDASGTTAILLLRGLFEAYVSEQSFKAHALLHEPAKVEKAVDRLRGFHALITRPSCEEAVADFRATLRSAAVHYGYDVTRLKKLLADERCLGELRLSALNSRDALAVHQFAQGAPDPAPLQYNRQIFEFSNVNSFLAALHKQWVSGITLALIRSQDDDRAVYMAYFALGLRNGDNLTILTDHEEGVHPDYHHMTRRPERQLDERARQHWFPYRLLDEDPVKRAKRQTALVRMDPKAVPIDEVETLDPSEFVWLTLLFELVAQKYGGDFRAEEISYTGEMVVAPHALVDGNHALVLAGQYQPLVLPALTPETATVEAADNRVPVGHNAWMEERYRDRVPAILLDVVGDRRALEVGRQVKKLLPGAVKERDLPAMRRQPGLIGWWTDHRKTPIAPRGLDPTSFGTRAQIARNVAWTARVNLTQAIQKLAVEEFAKKSDLVLRWYRARVTRNLPFLLAAVARGELVAPTLRWQSDVDHDFPRHDAKVWGTDNILRQATGKDAWHAFPGDQYQTKSVTFGEWNEERRCTECFLERRDRATVFSLIEPDNPRALALVCGIPERKVPWPLQHWWTWTPYTGNSILDRVDPQDSRLDNPWRHLELRVAISLSKRAFKRLRKEHGLS